LDFISSDTIEITTMALDGLSKRHKVISSNIANAETPGYIRQEVSFENQLKNIITAQNAKEMVKASNSQGGLSLSPQSINALISGMQPSGSGSFLTAKNSYGSFNPQVNNDTASPEIQDGNNVNVEKEMVELAKTGMRYNILSELQGKKFRGYNEIIKGAI